MQAMLGFFNKFVLSDSVDEGTQARSAPLRNSTAISKKEVAMVYLVRIRAQLARNCIDIACK
jgi:hypothetical protein